MPRLIAELRKAVSSLAALHHRRRALATGWTSLTESIEQARQFKTPRHQVVGRRFATYTRTTKEPKAVLHSQGL